MRLKIRSTNHVYLQNKNMIIWLVTQIESQVLERFSLQDTRQMQMDIMKHNKLNSSDVLSEVLLIKYAEFSGRPFFKWLIENHELS